jgi:hypothetical protein
MAPSALLVWSNFSLVSLRLIFFALEIDKLIVEQYPLLNHKPALMRAYKRTVSKEGGGDGDDWVVCDCPGFFLKKQTKLWKNSAPTGAQRVSGTAGQLVFLQQTVEGV